MTMNPGDIFAAHMWPWPDPLVKRDAAGHVLTVNAAFLAIYGGRIEDWHGRVIEGWPAPQPSSTPKRFESLWEGDGRRIIYDWVEMTLPDGSAMAIARDVTAYAERPAPGQQDVPVPSDAAAHQPQADTASFETPPPLADAHPQEPPQPQPSMELESSLGDLSAMLPSASAPEPASQAAPAPAEDPPAPETASQSAPLTDYQPPAPEAAQRDEAQPATERKVDGSPLRTLPLEKDSKALGGNWRDAVIAKATGKAIEEPAAPEQPDAPEPEKTQPAPAASAVSDAEPEPEKAGDGLRILLAEDNAINALLTRTLLEAEGCTVDVVEDGALAVDAVKRSYYDMIFMDMRMPNMDGLEATRAIRQLDDDIKDITIIALTANAFDDDRRACFDSGMNDFMTKPVSADELISMVNTWVEKAGLRKAS